MMITDLDQWIDLLEKEGGHGRNLHVQFHQHVMYILARHIQRLDGKSSESKRLLKLAKRVCDPHYWKIWVLEQDKK